MNLQAFAIVIVREGVQVPWGGGTRIVPPFTCRQVLALYPQCLARDNARRSGVVPEVGHFSFIQKIVLELMQRRYPETSLAEVEANLFPAMLPVIWLRLWERAALDFAKRPVELN